MIVGFQKVTIRLSSIVRQRIGIDRTLVKNIIKYLVTVIRLKNPDFSITGGTVKKSLDGIAKYLSQVIFFPDAKCICLSFMKGILIIWRFFSVSVRYSVVFFYTGKKTLS